MNYYNAKGCFLEKFDIFGVPITIRFNQRETNKTLAGALSTFIIIGVLIYQVQNVIQELINYQNVNIIFQEEIVQIPQRFAMDPSSFPFAIGLLADNLKYINDNQVFYITAEYLISTREFNQTTQAYQFTNTAKNFNMVKCTNQHFQMESTKDYFLSLPFQDLYCIDLNAQVEIEGQYGADIYKRLKFKIHECQQGVCKEKSVRQKFLNNCQLQIFYPNYSLQITNHTEPFQSFGQSYFWKVGNNTLKNINVFFRNTFLESKQGILLTTIENHNRIIYSFDREQSIQSFDDSLFELYLNLEKNKESHYYRKYQTLIQAFSQIGGLFNFLLCIGALISRPISRLIFQQKLLNQIFSFKIQDDDGDDDNLIKFKSNLKKQNSEETKIGIDNQTQNNHDTKKRLNNKTPNIQNKSNQTCEINQSMKLSQFNNDAYLREDKSPAIAKKQNSALNIKDTSPIISKQESLINSSNINQNTKIASKSKLFQKGLKVNSKIDQKQNQLEQLFNKKDNNKTYHVSFFDILKSIISQQFKCIPTWSLSPKSQMIEYGLQKLNQHLEINYIIDKLLELEKLKKLMLNYEQIKLFDLVPKPIIEKGYFDGKDSQQVELQKTHLFHAKAKNLQEKIKDAQEAFNLIIVDGNQQISETNKKLLQFLDPKLIDYLEKNNEHLIKLSQTKILQKQSIAKKASILQDSTAQMLDTFIFKNISQQQDNLIDSTNSDRMPPEENTTKEDVALPQSFLQNSEIFNQKFKIPQKPNSFIY